MDNQRLLIDDQNFYRRAITELSNVEMYLQPIYNDALKLCGKCYKLRSQMAQQCIPMMIDFKEAVEERNRALDESIQGLKDVIRAMDAAMGNIENIPSPVTDQVEK